MKIFGVRFSMKVNINTKGCCGCELCPDVCPDVFEMRSDKKAHVKSGSIRKVSEITCREITRSCPMSAIKITR